MNPINAERSAELARALFDTIVAPLAEAKRAANATPYFPLRGEPGALSYFVAPSVSTMQPADFQLGGHSAEGLIEALAAFWSSQGEAELAAMAPRLKDIAQALIEEAATSDGNVDVLCYTLF